jgi:hypothetical protein
MNNNLGKQHVIYSSGFTIFMKVKQSLYRPGVAQRVPVG